MEKFPEGSGEEFPGDARSPGKDPQVKLAHCQAQAVTGKYGWTLVLTPEDLGCGYFLNEVRLGGKGRPGKGADLAGYRVVGTKWFIP